MIRVWRVDSASMNDARAALQSILQDVAGTPVTLARRSQGKPYLPAAPHIRFNLSHTRGKALIAVATEVEVGVDIERHRPVPDFAGIAERYLPPGDAQALQDTPEPAREREFFRRWTRAEALWKAAGVGLLHGAGAIPEGEWDVREIDAGEGYSAAVAASRAGMEIEISDWGAAT
ncbi:MAG TPA: 4'-phosphopantetheinyl transferase superfamily protein [Candidatus Sulfopaludibacter sp.]|nr:4'-phosphopantetheinyl transferase superfamily protein [Candidatus Sulfopaludibacter sp.]